MKLVLAPNAFKNSLLATKVAEALKKGLLESELNAPIICCPVGDGGDGTGVLLCNSLKAEMILYEVDDPLGRKINAPMGWVEATKTAVIEMADASGLRLLKPLEYNPKIASTAGCGQLIKAALDKGAKKILLCIGGSATVDGGTGILKELGIIFKDANNKPLEKLPIDLIRLHSIDPSGLDQRILNTNITILCDVKNKLLGAKGAAAVFGPQKGADKEDVQLLEKALQQLNTVTLENTGTDMSAKDFSGAAGGVAAALGAYCKAKTVDGISYFLELIHFSEALKEATHVITGEGAIDHQTLDGKAPFGVAKMARQNNCKVIAVAGKVPDAPDAALNEYFDWIFSINEKYASIEEAIKNTEINLIKAGERIGTAIKNNIAG